MREIAQRAYSIVEHCVGRAGTSGQRRVNARDSLVEKGLVRVAFRTRETDSHHGFSTT